MSSDLGCGRARLRQTGPVDRTPDRVTPGEETAPHRRAHTTARDLERYARLFAERTTVMRSSAMRDLMEITARPEVISLAGGLPDTSTFPPERFAAQMTRIAQESSRPGASVRADRGLRRDQGVHPRGDGGRGHGARPRRHDRHHRRPAGDRPGREDARRPRRRRDRRGADLPGRGPGVLLLPGRDAAGRRSTRRACDVDELEAPARAPRAARAARPKFIYTVPSFQNPAGVTMSAERRRRLVAIARERELLVVEDNPYGLLRYEGEPQQPLYKLDGRRLRHLPRHALEDPLAGDPARLAVRAAAGDGEGRARQAGDRPLHLDADPVLRPRVLRRGGAGATTSTTCATSTATAATRCSTRSSGTSRAEARWSRPAGGLFCWATLPAYIDTTDLLAKALRDNVAFVPGAAAYVDGRGRLRCGSTSRPRAPDEIREGIQRIGAVIAEQVGALRVDHGEHQVPNVPPASSASRPGAAGSAEGRASVLPFRRQGRQ